MCRNSVHCRRSLFSRRGVRFILATTVVLSLVRADDPAIPTAFPSNQTLNDDRTLLDVFGEVAKEYLTQKVIPSTDEQCRWDWRFVRCEPFCQCSLDYKWGDYHLGRACRLRPPDDPPSDCHVPPNHAYVHLVQAVLQVSKQISEKTQETTKTLALKKRQQWNQMQSQVCEDLPTECHEKREDQHRNWKQRLLCTHISSSPCDDDIQREGPGGTGIGIDFIPPTLAGDPLDGEGSKE